jgi:redox-sensitive bicupin YhaK (pirin superfamily)
MEIITYVRKGAITHKDSLGNVGRTEAGDVQVMTAGTGIVHEEYNREADITQIFQIWILPARKGLAPRWDSRPFPQNGSGAGLLQLASGRKPHNQAMVLNADADLYGANLAPNDRVRYTTDRSRYLYLLPATGHVRVDGVDVHAGDGLAIKDRAELSIEAQAPSEVLLIDVAS